MGDGADLPAPGAENVKSRSWEEFIPPDARLQRLHQGIRLDPEAVWDEFRTYLCEPTNDPLDAFRVDLVEDLMFWHADAFVDRVEALARECPQAGKTIAWAIVDGTAAPGVDRFHLLQERLLYELEAEGFVERG